ncbi:MAG: translocation/assembly module TamB domain-containing protein [Desulfovibrionaceae bacterium]|nr:translocation/assembly module TamB domain-containing protein [Desulfovibrionaceae bacterium]
MRPAIFKWGKRFLKILGGSLAAIMVAALALALWLRTPYAERVLLGLARSELAGYSLNLELDEFRGPLPLVLSLRGVRLLDGQGLCFTAREMEIRLQATALLQGEIHVELLRILEPELLRAPALPQAPESENEEEEGQEMSLPLDLRLGMVDIRNGRIGEALRSMLINARGGAFLSSSGLAANLDASLLHPDGTGFSLELRTEPRPMDENIHRPLSIHGHDYLHLRLSAREAENGFLAGLIGRSDTPAYDLLVEGSGSPQSWQGAITFMAESGNGELISGQGRMSLAALVPDIDFSRILDARLYMDLTLQATPGPALPEDWRAFFQPSLDLRAEARYEDQSLRVNALAHSGMAWELDLRELSLRTRPGGLLAQGGFQASLRRESPALRQYLPGDLRLETRFQARLGRALSLGLEGEAALRLDGGDISLDYALDSSLRGNVLTLRSFRCSGAGINALAQGDLNLDNGGMTAQADLRAAAGGAWKARLEELLDQPGGIPDGDLALDLRLASVEPPLSRGASGWASGFASGGSLAVNFAGRKMLWPASWPAEFLGDELALEADLSIQNDAYALHLTKLASGLAHLEGQADLRGVSAGLSKAWLKAGLNLHLDDLDPLIRGGLFSQARRGEASLADISLYGPLFAPQVEISLNLADLRAPSSVILREVSADLEFAMDQGKIQGRSSLDFSYQDGGPVHLESAFYLHSDVRGLRAALSGFRVTGTDLLLAADLDFELPADRRQSPRLAGEVQLDIFGWRPLMILSGVHCSGDPASVSLSFVPESLGQRLDISWRAGRLDVALAEHHEFDIRDVFFSVDGSSGSAYISDLFQEPVLIMRSTVKRGQWGRFRWRQGELAVHSSPMGGAFNLSLLGSWRGGQSSRSGASPASSSPRAAEIALLAGYFDWVKSTLTVRSFLLRTPDQSAGIELDAPATLDFSRGLFLPELRLNLTAPAHSGQSRIRGATGIPAVRGALAASLDFGRKQDKFILQVQNMPFGLASLLVDSSFPEGAMSLDLHLARQGEEWNGQLDLRSEIMPESVLDRKPLDEKDAGRGAGSGHPEDTPLLFRLTAGLGAPPSSAFPRLSGQTGRMYLSGQGRLIYAGAPADTQEGRLEFALPLILPAGGSFPLPDRAAPLEANVFWQGPLDPFCRILPMADRELSGYSRIDLSLSGSLEAPLYTGSAYLTQGRYADRILGLFLDDISLEAQGKNRQLELLLAASDGGRGSLALQGMLDAPERTGQEAFVPRLRLHGRVVHLQPLRRDDLNVRLSGLLDIDGPLNAPEVTANIEVERGEYTLLASLGGSVETLEISRMDAVVSEKNVSGPSLRVTINIPGRFYVRGLGLDSEWAGAINVFGSPDEPLLSGSFRPVRGAFDLLSRPFVFTGGEIVLNSGREIDPILNLELTYTGSDIKALAFIQGRARRPRIHLSSIPPLPQDQVLSQVLFGKNSTGLSHFEALQLANSLRELSEGGSGLLGGMRQTLGVDMLRLSSGATGGGQRNTYGAPGAEAMGASSGAEDNTDAIPHLEAGKYINNAIYVGVEQGVTEDSTGVRVEVELRPNTILQGRSSTRSSEVGLGWKRDY